MEHDNSELVQPKTWLIPLSNETGGPHTLESSPKAAHKCDSTESGLQDDDTEVNAAQSDREKELEVRAAKMLNSDREKEGKQVEMKVLDCGIGEDKTKVEQALSKREDEQQLLNNDSHRYILYDCPRSTLSLHVHVAHMSMPTTLNAVKILLTFKRQAHMDIDFLSSRSFVRLLLQTRE